MYNQKEKTDGFQIWFHGNKKKTFSHKKQIVFDHDILKNNKNVILGIKEH